MHNNTIDFIMLQQTDISKMETTQTALDWFIQNMVEEGYIKKNEHFDLFCLLAKKMQRQQIEAAYNRGAWDGARSTYDSEFFSDSETYYKEKYESNT